MSSLFEESLSNYKDTFDAHASRFFDARFSGIYSDSDLQNMKRFVLRGGKRLRGYLTTLGYKMFAETTTDAVEEFSVGIELGHAGLLIQDDIFDNDSLRRSEPTMHISHGRSQALLYSYALTSLGYQLLLEAKFESSVHAAALSYLQANAFFTAVGEFMDLDYARKGSSVSEEELAVMTDLKTARYTVYSTLVVGAVLAGVRDNTLAVLEELAREIGVLFQMRDDFLPVLSSSSEMGKGVAGDISEGKQTYLTRFMELHGIDAVEEYGKLVFAEGDYELLLSYISEQTEERVAAINHSIDLLPATHLKELKECVMYISSRME